MATQFTPCPACGAVGEVGSNCQFCGTSILLKEGAIIADSRIVKQRTVTPQQYAEKISIYHNVVGLGEGISKVSIGEQEGIINLNGDLIYPLGNERITSSIQDGVVRIGRKFLNLETFEYAEELYSNKFVLEKIKLLSEAIKNNPSVEGVIQFSDTKGDYDILLEVCNATTCHINNEPGWAPQLAIRFMNIGMETHKFSHLFNRFASCDEFKLFETYAEDSAPIQERTYHALLGDNAEECCNIILRILHEIHEIHPENAANYMYCGEGVFDENQTNLNPNNDSNSTGGGCLGMFVLLISVGGAGIYGLTQLIGNLIA